MDEIKSCWLCSWATIKETSHEWLECFCQIDGTKRSPSIECSHPEAYRKYEEESRNEST